MARGGTDAPWAVKARAAGVQTPGDGRQGVLPWILSAGGTLLSSIWSARRADSAHQREVADLRRAGLNPILSAGGGRGAEIGQPPDVAGGINSGLALQRAKAEIRLLDAQSSQAEAAGMLNRTQAADISNTAASGRLELLGLQRDLASADLEQRRKILDHVVARAKEEVALTQSSSRAAAARAALDEAAERGALNEEEFQRMVGELGPWTRFLLEVLRGIRR